MWFNITKRRRKKFEPRVHVWKLKEEKTYKSMVRENVQKAEWKYLDVNDNRQHMKNLMVATAQDICGLSKGPCRHKETQRWNQEVAEAVTEKKIK